VAGTILQAPSRLTEAVSARRDFNAASVAWARLSWKSPSAALNTRRRAMIKASTYLLSTSSSTIAASSIHGTGAQNFSSAMRNGCTLVSGIALGPNFASWRRAASLVSPPFETVSGALVVAAAVGETGVRASVCLERSAPSPDPIAGPDLDLVLRRSLTMVSTPGQNPAP
jgi:hypothetical protein